jgi:hypothetical protein
MQNKQIIVNSINRNALEMKKASIPMGYLASEEGDEKKFVKLVITDF